MFARGVHTVLPADGLVSRAFFSNVARWLAIFALLALISLPTTGLAQSSFKRGDVDGDGCVGGTDFALFKKAFGSDITTLGVPCEDAYDFNDDGSPLIGIFDFAAFAAAVGSFETLPAPGGVTCGLDPTSDGLSCTTYTGCAKTCNPSACISTDISGTINLPPEGSNCSYLTETELHMIIDGLPSGSEVKVSVIHGGFTAITRSSGGTFPGGTIEQFDSTLRLEMEGTGALAGFNRVIELDAPTEIHSGPPSATGTDQLIEADMRSIQGEITMLTGDPDFETLVVTAGTANSLPSPGGAILEPMGGGFDVDSAFSVTYRIDFVGAAGGALDGLSGSTQGPALMALPEVSQVIPALSPQGLMLFGVILVAAMYITLRRTRLGRSGT